MNNKEKRVKKFVTTDYILKKLSKNDQLMSFLTTHEQDIIKTKCKNNFPSIIMSSADIKDKVYDVVKLILNEKKKIVDYFYILNINPTVEKISNEICEEIDNIIRVRKSKLKMKRIHSKAKSCKRLKK